MPARIRLPMDIDRAKLKQSILAAAKRHQAFRIRIASEDDELYGIYDDTAQLTFEEYTNATENAFLRAFDLTKAPLAHVGFTDDALLFDIHHIIADGESLYVILQEIQYAYEHGGEIEESRAGSESVEYSDYSDYFWKMDFSRHKEYFKRALVCDWEPIIIPWQKKVSENEGNSAIYALSEKTKNNIRAFARKNELTDTMIFLGAYIILLSKYSGRKDIITSVILSNRTHVEVQNTVGMFVNTLPIYTTTEGKTGEFFQQVKQLMLHLFEYQELPLSEIADYVGMNQTTVNTSFVFQNKEKRLFLNGDKLNIEFFETTAAKFDLSLEVAPFENSYLLRFEFKQSKFDKKLIEKLYESYIEILAQLGKAFIKDISILSKTKQQKVLLKFNQTEINYPDESCIHELFMNQAEQTPERLALIFEDKCFSYRQLNQMSNSLAHLLRQKGIKRNDIIPIITKRSWHVIVAMLGVLKAGGAFMFIDPDYPSDRIDFMLSEIHAKYILIYNYDKTLQTEQFIDLNQVNYDENLCTVQNQNCSKDLCYILFTSGSTGLPKAALINHTNLVNFISINDKNVYQTELINTCKNVLAVTTFTFDIFIFETFLPLLNGLTVVMSNNISSAEQIAALIKNHRIDAIHITPTRLWGFLQNKNFQKSVKQIKLLMLGAETLTYEYYKQISNYTEAVIYNGYGPTETTIGCSFKRISKADDKINSAKDITIGKPIANTQFYILNKDLNPLPVGITGQLFIAGACVGNGYLNRDQMTAEQFIYNPFATEENGHGKIMYNSGDLACWQENGEIRYLGRIDTQVKIRGLRIELGEIESIMNHFPGIKLSVVSDKCDSTNRQYLVGYYMSDSEINKKILRQYLSSKLPGYMTPNYFVRLKNIPITLSGKIDRNRLPLPDFTVQAIDYEKPATDTEYIISKIWGELLHVETIGRNDSFLDIGGDSFTAISVLNELESEFHVEVSLKNIIECTSLKDLALIIDNAKKTNDRIIANHKNAYKLLPQQKAIYLHYCKNPSTLAYNMPVKIELPKTIMKDKLKNSIKQVLDLHKLLKTSIEMTADDVYGIYQDSVEITFEEYTGETISDFVRPFDLSKAPLIHIGFFNNILLFDIHHIIVDGTSIDIILRDIALLYQGHLLKINNIEFSDYVEYFYKKDFKEYKSYFKAMLGNNFESVKLPEGKKGLKAGGASKQFYIHKKAKKYTQQFAAKNGLTETMVLFGAYGILLSKYTAQEHILSSIILSNRVHPEVKNVVGMFVNTLPLYVNVSGEVMNYFSQIRQLILHLLKYQELPFVEVADYVGMKDKTVINTCFIFQGSGEPTLFIDEHNLIPQFVETNTAKFDLLLEVTPLKEQYRIRFEYNQAKYTENMIACLYESYVQILSQLTALKIEDISVISRIRLHQILLDFNKTAVKYCKTDCVHQLFTYQAEKMPEKAALVFEKQTFCYRQLEEMSNSLAHILQKKGVTANDIVPIIAKRSWHIIVAMLGILKAGGAYMPVDPSYPNDRIRAMLSSAGPKVILQYGYKKSLPYETLDLEQINYFCHTSPVKNINTAEDTCYVIFTSGSTGQPKGISLSHYNVMNFIQNNTHNPVCQEMIRNGWQSIVSVTNIIFDIFVTESLMPLLNGITTYLANDSQSWSQTQLSQLICSNHIEIMQTTPTKMRSYMDDETGLNYLKLLKCIILAGEALPKDLVEKLKTQTNADIYNNYGPAETTVWSTNKRITDEQDITIGRPIANTQIYILDKNQSLLPIGVPGELCIAGDGVGKGYLNQPELTASRFLPNPFATKENGHGAVMYRTGDLACWTEDGEIRYLGRIDTQVKIRGLRIELGEIESAMATVSGIRLTAAAEKRDSSGRQYLVGYYVTNTEIEQQELRQQLSLTLPRYMIPHFFMRLEQMPMTPSGKIDRKNLPSPDFSLPKTDYTAPRTEQERILCKALSDVLGVEPIGIEDDFFEMGGDSLKAIEFTAKAHQAGIHLALQQIFDYPSVKQLCEYIEKGTADSPAYTAADFASFKPLLQQNVIREPLILKQRPLGNVLLTGATGFLGAHILDALMKKETGVIYCLVRGSDSEHAGKRLIERLRYYFGDIYEKEIGRRLIPIAGDIEQETFRDGCPADVQTVIHAAASVKHYGSYEYFYKANVLGTQHVAAFARAAGARLIHISTLSVSGNSMADEFSGYRSDEEIQFDETSFFVGQPLDNVYIRSKFEAEHAVFRSMSAGLDAKIIRVGNLTNRASDYKFQPNYKQNAFLTRLKALLEFGLFPDYLLPLYSEFSPVDLTAEGVVRIAMYSDSQCVFHLNSNRPVYFNRLMELLQELKIPMKVVDGAVFDRKLRETMRKAETEYIFEALQNDIAPNGSLIYDSNIHIKNDVTMWFLQHTGFQWNEIDDAYIRGYIHYFCSLGYLEIRHEK